VAPPLELSAACNVNVVQEGVAKAKAAAAGESPCSRTYLVEADGWTREGMREGVRVVCTSRLLCLVLVFLCFLRSCVLGSQDSRWGEVEWPWPCVALSPTRTISAHHSTNVLAGLASRRRALDVNPLFLLLELIIASHTVLPHRQLRVRDY
jgi:hypothetical protein